MYDRTRCGKLDIISSVLDFLYTYPCNHTLPVLSLEKLRIEICRLDPETIEVREQFFLTNS